MAVPQTPRKPKTQVLNIEPGAPGGHDVLCSYEETQEADREIGDPGKSRSRPFEAQGKHDAGVTNPRELKARKGENL